MARTDWPFSPEAPSGGWQVQASDSWTGMYWIEEAADEQEAAMGGSDLQAARSEAHDSNNANLIAAAPRMYRVLKGLLEGRSSRGWDAVQKLIDEIDENLRG